MTLSERRARRSTSPAQLGRAAALHRIGRTRRWAIIGAAGATAGIAAVVSSVAPGKTLKPRSATRSVAGARSRPRSGSLRMPPLATPGELGLQGPSQAPQPAPAPSQSTPDQSQAAPDPSQAAPD